MTPERLDDLRDDCRKAIENEWHIVRLGPKELLELLDAADNLAALLAAAEQAAFMLSCKRMAMEVHDFLLENCAAIRRAKGEQP